MPRPYTISTTRPFKGLRTSVPRHTLDPGEMSSLINLGVDRSGALVKRKGIVKTGAATHPGAANQKLRIMCLVIAVNFGLRQPVLFAYDNNQLFRNVGITNPVWNAIPTGTLSGLFEWGVQAGSAAAPYYVHGVRRNGQTFAVDSLTGTVAATAGPEGTMNCVYKSRMWVINSVSTVAGLESRLYFSAAGNYSVWTAPSGGFIDINLGDGQGLISLAVYNDTLFIFKDKSIYAIDASSEDQTTYIPRLVHPTLGSAGRGSVQLIDGFMYFYSIEGVYRTDGTTFEEISEPIRDIFQKMANNNTVEQMVKTEAAYWDGKYMLSRQSSDPHLYVYDTISESWSLWNVSLSSGVSGFSGFATYPELQNEHMYFGDTGGANGGHIYGSIAQVEWYRDNTVGQSGGTAANDYTCTAELGSLDMDHPGEIKRNYYNALDIEGSVADECRLIPKGRTITASYTKVPTSSARQILRFPGTGRNRYNALDSHFSIVAGQTPGPLKIYGIQTADLVRDTVNKPGV